MLRPYSIQTRYLPMSNPKHTIQTERLVLSPFALEHLDGLFAMNRNPAVMRYLGDIQTREETKAGILRVQARWQKYGYGWWTILLRKTGAVIGAACLQNLAHTDDAPLEIGWRLMPEYHGKGFATEAGRAAMEFGFNQVGVERLVAVAHPENIASQKVMQRLGMQFAGVETHYDQDCAVFEIAKP